MPFSRYANRKDAPCPVVDRYKTSALGSQRIGEAEVNCGYLGKQSKWGLIDQQQQGAVLRLDMAFIEPPGHKLASADVHFHFEGDDDDTANPPAVTEHVYPKIMCGPPLTHNRTRNHAMKPEAEVSGFLAFGGLGSETSRNWEDTRRWMFQSHRAQADNTIPYYTKVRWTWEANKYNPQSELKHPMQMGVVIEHSGSPFKTKLIIHGKSAKGLRRYKITTAQPTYRKFHPPVGALADIASAVESLEAEIEEQNRKKVLEYEPGLNQVPQALETNQADQTYRPNALEPAPQGLPMLQLTQ